jgi:hypothetical protein
LIRPALNPAPSGLALPVACRRRLPSAVCAAGVCPHGDDPDTDEDEAEVQLLSCTADPSSAGAGGSFALGFRSEVTPALSASVGPGELADALRGLRTIGDVAVSYSAGAAACAPDGSNVIAITFITVRRRHHVHRGTLSPSRSSRYIIAITLITMMRPPLACGY